MRDERLVGDSISCGIRGCRLPSFRYLPPSSPSHFRCSDFERRKRDEEEGRERKRGGGEERRREKNGIDRSRCFPDCEPSETGRRENPDWLTVRTCSLNESKIAASSFAWMQRMRSKTEGVQFFFLSYGFVFRVKLEKFSSGI